MGNSFARSCGASPAPTSTSRSANLHVPRSDDYDHLLASRELHETQLADDVAARAEAETQYLASLYSQRESEDRSEAEMKEKEATAGEKTKTTTTTKKRKVVSETVARSPEVARAGSKRKRPPAEEEEEAARPTTAGRTVSEYLMEAAARRAREAAAAKRAKTTKTSAFDAMMGRAETPGAFDLPPTRVLLDRCRALTDLAGGEKSANHRCGHDDEEDGEDDDGVGAEDWDVYEAADGVSDMEVEFANEVGLKNEEYRKNILDAVIFERDSVPPVADAGVNSAKPGPNAYVTKVAGYTDLRLTRNVVVGLAFHYSDGAQIVYGGDVKGAKVSEVSLGSQGQIVKVETWHCCVPRMLQRIDLVLSNGRTIHFGEKKASVSVHRLLEAEDGHVVRELQWLPEESTVLSLKTQPLDSLPVEPPEVLPSLVHLARKREDKRLRADARRRRKDAKSSMKKNWVTVRHRLEHISNQYQDLMRATDEAKALNELKVIQDLLTRRFKKRAEALKSKAKEEMEGAMKSGREKEEEIRRKYVTDGSACLEEHQSVVKYLASTIGIDPYVSMKIPTVCSSLSCRKTFDLAKLPAAKLCSHPGCAAKEVNCGCQTMQCSICYDSYCGRHYECHHKKCSAVAKQKCGWHKASGTVKPWCCHGFAYEEMRACDTCDVLCCEDCRGACSSMDRHHYSDYVLCNKCKLVAERDAGSAPGSSSKVHDYLCFSCYHDRARA